ncbi:hypothetical protein N7456_007216 [Penicillium angulare]|uniref:Uncharacterized protein n=1 Tax=Penicillium angulare TaxID=116970 RepID=A0A9W9FJB8_9EURO|nr:hypothetical protein N7456_007216 [Penicillium angulare]
MPDIVMTDEDDRVGAVGEVKTPWILRLTYAIEDEQERRNLLAPLSTEPGITPTKDQEFALWHSDVIRHNKARASQLVSLRECFLFLGIKIRDGDNKCRNTMRLNDWIGKSSGSSNRYGGYISPPDPPSYAERRKRAKGRRAHELLLYGRSQGQNVSGPEWLQSQDKLSQSQTEIKYCETFFEGAESHGVEYLLEEDRNHQGYPILYRNQEGCLFERRGNRLHSVNLPLKESNTIGEWHYEVKGLPYIVDLRELRP